MTKTLPPILGHPLDYVPIDRTTQPITPTRFNPPTLKRAAVAAAIAGTATGIAFFAPIVALGALAIAIVTAGVWATDKLIKAIDSHGE
ncbi:hypothetical protein CWR43_27955 [Rhizobium sullae]|uniref:Uncharacterized protein n=1 Tax=Rhizobium sullae TaxID=50338 RepID=A0A2N0D305_RHISU|nr:hypothetical protein [Rhizobium sullae]PKA40418.1 hypothetical protein CWR43_27955 [Rhizobium sullae]